MEQNNEIQPIRDNMSFVLFLIIMLLFISGVVSFLVTADNAPKLETKMVKGDLINLQAEDKYNIKFAFIGKDKKHYSNYDIKRDYEIVVNDKVKTPEVEYEQHSETIGDKTKTWVTDDSGLRIKIIMNQKDYRSLFGEPDIQLKEKEITSNK